MYSEKQKKFARTLIRAINDAMKPFVAKLRVEEKQVADRRKKAVAEAKRLGVKDVLANDRREPKDLGSDEGEAWVATLHAVALLREEELIEDQLAALKASLDEDDFWDGRVVSFNPSDAVRQLAGAELEWEEYSLARMKREKAIAAKVKRKQASARRKKTG